MEGTGELTAGAHCHCVVDARNLHWHVVAARVALPQLAMGAAAPTGDGPILVKNAGVQIGALVVGSGDGRDIFSAR